MQLQAIVRVRIGDRLMCCGRDSSHTLSRLIAIQRRDRMRAVSRLHRCG